MLTYIFLYLKFARIMQYMLKDSNYFCYKYPHPAVSADSMLFGYSPSGLHVLLIERGNEPYMGCWALPGGFMEIDETAEQCAARELQEETGLSGIHLEQFHTLSAVNRDPRERVITVVFFALVRTDRYHAVAGDDAKRVQWFPIDNLPALAFDHSHAIAIGTSHLLHQLHLWAGGYKKPRWDFSSSEVQAMVEQLSGL